MTVVERRGHARDTSLDTGNYDAAVIHRYSFVERVVHWSVAITFILLMLGGLALAYPRLHWLANIFGGGTTMRATHPWIGLVFTVGIVYMLLKWIKGMVLTKVDFQWLKKIGTYAKHGHVDVDTGKWNAGQKLYYWLAVILGLVLLFTGIPIWADAPGWLGDWGRGWQRWGRFIHLTAFLLMVGGFIIHVLLSAFLFPGTMNSMNSGKVSRAWAAFHHPRWFREVEGLPENQPVDPFEINEAIADDRPGTATDS